MRTRQALKNAAASFLLEVIAAISGIILPRVFTAQYGSSVNGLVSSIGQFITYMGLVEAGIGAAGTVSLYKPLAEGDYKSVSGIVSAAKRFYRNSGFIFLGLDIILIIGYPFLVKNEIADAAFVRMMIVILSLSGVVDYFILGKYRVLLTADQKNYIISIAQIAGTVITLAVSVLLIRLGASALAVKSVAAVVYILRCAAIVLYVRRNYKELDRDASPDTGAFSQRWAALLHQVVGMVCNNTGVILLTVMLAGNALKEVSVYSVYNLVLYALYSMLNSVSNGLSASFGQVIARKEAGVLKESFSTFEYLVFILAFAAFTCMGVLLYPFIGLYSAEFTDGVVYARPTLVVLFTLAGLLESLRLPGLTLIIAGGHYKETRTRAILEAGINLSVSLVLVKPLGIAGVLLGMCASYMYRSTDTVIYGDRHFVRGTLRRSAVRILRNAAASLVLAVLGVKLVMPMIHSWIAWFAAAAAFGVFTGALLVAVNAIFEPKEFSACINRVKQLVLKRT